MVSKRAIREFSNRFLNKDNANIWAPPSVEPLESRTLFSSATVPPRDATHPAQAVIRPAATLHTTLISLLPSANPVGFGTSLSITAGVSSDVGQPSGSMTLTDGTTTLLVFPESGGALAIISPNLSAGTHTITASFVDISNTWQPSTTSIALVVNPIVTTTSIAIPSTTLRQAQPANFTVTSSSISPISGRVQFFDGGTPIGSTTVATANAQPTIKFAFSTSILTVGSHLITANFIPDSSNDASSSSFVNLTVLPLDGTTTTVWASVSPDGFTDLLSASVSSAATGGPITGSVVFSDAAGTLGTAQVNAGHADFTLGPALHPGTYSITAIYSGDSTFLSSNGSTPLIVGRYATSIGFQIGGNAVLPGSSVLVAANVNPNGQNNANRQPLGTVTIKDGSNVVGSGTLDSTGNVTFSITAPATGGDHVLQAFYSGDNWFLPSNSNTGTLTVRRTSGLQTATIATFSPNNAPIGTQVTLTASVTAATGVPQGSVFFIGTDKNGHTNTITTVALDAQGHAVFNASPSNPGAFGITAVYVGDNTYASSSSAVIHAFLGTPHQRYVQELYKDLFQRDADPAGLNAWAGALDSGQTYNQIAVAITSSREYDGDIVDAFYVSYLGRHAEQGGLTSWVDQMQAGLNAETIRAGILGSQEYYNITGGTNASYVTALYQTFLSRTPDAGGLAAWEAMLADPTKRQAVASGISASDENRTAIIRSFYVTYLHRTPDAGGLAAWKVLLANGISQPHIIASFVTSPEYLSFNQIP